MAGKREHDETDILTHVTGGTNTYDDLVRFLVFWHRNKERGFVVREGIAYGVGCEDSPEFGGCCADSFDLETLVDDIGEDGLRRMTVEEAVERLETEKRTAEEIAHANRYANRCPVEGCAMPGSTHQGDHVGADGKKLEGPANPRRKTRGGN